MRTPSEAALAVMRRAIESDIVTARYRALTHPAPSGCTLWTGAISGKGHGRFWLGRAADQRSVTVIAHRWAWALAHTLDDLLAAATIQHRCDNPLCQNVDHLQVGGHRQNTIDGIVRRTIIGNPLRDTRGAHGRAHALRAAARTGADLDAAARAGLPDIDRYQDPLIP